MRTNEGKSADHGNQKANWDDPHGLGWQLWLRNRTHGLSHQSIQRQVERFRSIGLFRHPSLAADIQRRWQISRQLESYRFHSGLPLFNARYAFPSHQFPARHVQAYPQQVSNFAAYPFPSTPYSPGVATAAPRTATFSGYSTLRKKPADVLAQQEDFNSGAATAFEQSATNPLPVELQSAPDKTLDLDSNTASVTNEPVPIPDGRQLPGNAPHDATNQENSETADPMRGKPPVHVEPTESVLNLLSSKPIEHILQRKPTPNLFHSVSHSTTQDQSPTYFPGHFKLSNPLFSNITPLLSRKTLKSLTTFGKEGTAATLVNGSPPLFAAQKKQLPPQLQSVMRTHSGSRDQTTSISAGLSKNTVVGISRNHVDQIKPAVHEVLSPAWSGNDTEIIPPLVSPPFAKLMAPSRQTADFPSSRPQHLTEKEVASARQVPVMIATWRSPGRYSEQNSKSPSLRYGTIQQLSEPVKKNTPTLHALSLKPFPSFSALTLQPAGRVGKNTMRTGTPLANSSSSKSIISLSDEIKRIDKEPTPLSLPPPSPMFDASKAMEYSPSYSTLGQVALAANDKTPPASQRGKNEVGHPIKIQMVSRQIGMDSPVQPSNSRTPSARIPGFSDNSPKQHANLSSQRIAASLRQLHLPRIQSESTQSKTRDSSGVPHQLTVRQKSLAGTGPADIYNKISQPANLTVAGSHIFLSETATPPSPLTNQTNSPGFPLIVGLHDNALLYPAGRNSLVRHLTNNPTANLAPSRLFLKRSAPPPADRDTSQQTDRMHSKDAPPGEISFVGQDMPLAPMPSTQGRAHSFSSNANDDRIVQTSPLNLAKDTAPAGVIGAPSAHTATENSTAKQETGHPPAAIDLDELVEKAWLKIMRKLTIERERRGLKK